MLAETNIFARKSTLLQRSLKQVSTSPRPCLWFNGQAEEAANFYVSVFKNSRITQVSRYGEGTPMPARSRTAR